jgi:DNA polymerase kappa
MFNNRAKSETPDIGRPSPRPTASTSTSTVSGSSRPKPKTQTFVCPICAKELQTDNDGLNSHVDFCLSKGAIMEATSPASGLGAFVTPVRAKVVEGKGKRKAKEGASASTCRSTFKRPKGS